jgi:hypothetical protein
MTNIEFSQNLFKLLVEVTKDKKDFRKFVKDEKAIKQLFLDVIGEKEEQKLNFWDRKLDGRNELRDKLRQIVRGEK